MLAVWAVILFFPQALLLFVLLFKHGAGPLSILVD
jgi:hypothetical protein